MRMIEPSPETLAAATAGDLHALDALLSGIQPGVHGLALRMLGRREDAADATQEILLKVVTHLASFRGGSAFTTWVWSVARNHLLTARTRAAEHPEVSLEAIGEKLDAGLDLVDRLAPPGRDGAARTLTPEEKLEARQVAVSCTQSMLMALDRDQRLVYLLDSVFDLSSTEAAQVLGLTPEAYRQRLSRAKARLEPFMRERCGLVDEAARCRCERQVDALKHVAATAPEVARARRPALVLKPVELAEAERAFAAYGRVVDAAAVFRALPELEAPASMRAAIRAVLTQEGFMDRGAPQ
ncbi:MAG: RNA polymerase sigma factor [Burkholderiales bacterium]|nr:RNA polymerase sigma factor [Burkholderiales bacterium]